jgi:acyl-CoA synthetase (AMP-forming)/AMP-acid ligase II
MIALHALLSSARNAQAPVCRDGAHVLDVAAFRVRVFAIARALQDRREPQLSRYALCIDDPFDFACMLFAMFVCGKEPVIPANSTPGYLADLAHAYDVVLTDVDLIGMMIPPASAMDGAAASAACVPPEWSGQIDRHASLTMFTSGSSGVPKPVRKTLAQLDAEARTLESEWGALLGDTTVLCSVPHHHMYGLTFRLMWPLAAGRAFERALCTEPAQMQACLAQCGAAVVISTPAMLSRWPAMTGFSDLSPTPRAFFSAGSALSAVTTAEYVQAFGAAPIDIYGSTEAGVIAWRRIDISGVWQPMTGIDVRLGHENVLEILTPHIGHVDVGEATRDDALEEAQDEIADAVAESTDAVQGNWYSTDDIVALDASGGFRLTGRRDRVIKLAGKRVSLTEIEARLVSHPYVRATAAVVLDKAPRQSVGAVSPRRVTMRCMPRDGFGSRERFVGTLLTTSIRSCCRATGVFAWRCR